jgi:hypothetical protein
MPSYVVRNEQFRDEVLKYAYPFDEQSELENDELYIGTDLIIDAVFYIKTAVDLPLYIGVVDGTEGTIEQVKLVLYDSTGTTVGDCLIDYQTDAVTVRHNGIPVGALVFETDSLQRFIGRVSGKVFVLLPSVATFMIDVCHVSTTPHLRAVVVGDSPVTGDVRIIARHGCRFELTAEGLRLDILAGDDGQDARQPVRSINGVQNPSIWLAGHPRANLRISNQDGELTFGQAKDLV